MLVLSIFSTPVITSILPHHPKRVTTLSPNPTPLFVLPDSFIFIYTNYIYIYTWFYNQFILPLYHPWPRISRITPRHKPSRLRRYCSSYKSFILLLYLFFNVFITVAVHQDYLPVHVLLYLPTLLSAGLLTSFLPHPTRPSWNRPSSNCLTFDLSTNAGKLAYLSAWQSADNDTPICLMNFTPGGRPICLDTGATSCIFEP